MLTKNIDTMKAEVAAHIAADAVVAGHYWEDANNDMGGTGCFIGCLTRSSKAEGVTDRFGLPVQLVRIAEHIFEALPAINRVDFFAAVPHAIDRDGRDLSRLHWSFLRDLLEHLPPQSDDIKMVIDPIIDGMKLLESGRDWPGAFAADIAARSAIAPNADRVDKISALAASAASAAAHAAFSAPADFAVRAADYAARATGYGGYSAEIKRQRDVFLELIKNA